jgi:gluconolactonase
MTSPYVSTSFNRQILAEGLDHAEGVCWDPSRNCLWAGGEAGQIYRIGLDGTVVVDAVIAGGELLGLALDGVGNLYLCDVGNHVVWQWAPGNAPARFGPMIDYPNYAAFGPDVTLYVSDSGSFLEPTGSIVAIAPDGSSRRLDIAPIKYANGLAVRERYLYFVASSLPGVQRVSLDGGASETVVQMARCVPDGLAFDVEGSLYISCYQPNQLWRLDRSGRLECLVDDWTGEFVLSPTNVAFYGERLERLALASLCGRTMTSIDIGVAGESVVRPIGRTRT